MRVAFVSIPNFPCAVEIQRQPQLTREALIVSDDDRTRRVFDCSPNVGELRIRPGMTVRQAASRCPEAIIVPADLVRYRTVWEEVFRSLTDISPEVEDDDWGRAYVNVSGLERHYHDEAGLCRFILDIIKEASGLEASIGLASGRFIAYAAGSIASQGEIIVVPFGSEAAFLASLDSRLLPFDSETIFRLHLLGLEQIGDVATLTLPELQSQFGLQGKRLWEFANGIDNDPLRPSRHSPPLQTSISLEAPVAGIDVMIALARQLLSRLRSSLKGRAARELTLQAELTSGRGWEHRLVMREAVSEDERLAFLLRTALTNSPPPLAIRSLRLRLDGLISETGKQLSLDGKSRRLKHLEYAIQQLKTRYGYSPIYRCVDVEPWSVIPEERQILVESDA